MKGRRTALAPTHHWLGPKSEGNLLLPRAGEPDQNVRLRYVSDLGLVVVLGIVAEDDTFHLVGRPAQPALVEILQDRLQSSLGARHISHVSHAHAQGTSKDTAEVRCRVLQLISLVITLVQGDEDSQVVLAGHDLNRSARELGRDLVIAPGIETLLRAADVEGADWRVVGGLLSQV